MKRPSTFPIIAASTLFLAASFLLFSCDRDADEVPAQTHGDATQVPRGAKSGVVAEPPAEDTDAPLPPEEESLLSAGAHTVFGLRIPRGMIPITVPGRSNVHRFEGTHPLSTLKRWVMPHLESSTPPKRESGGSLLIKHATIKGAEAENGDALFAVRLFEGSLGGASLDIWKETPPVATPEASGGFYGGGTNAQGVDLDKKVYPPVVPAGRRSQARATMEVLEKLRKGEPLTEEDMNSPALY